MSERDPITNLTDEALIRAALDEETYDGEFRDRVQSELDLRGLSVSTFADHVMVKTREGIDSCNITDALRVFDELELWSPVEWVNALESRLTIQRDRTHYLAHRQDESGYLESTRMESAQTRTSLEAFLSLSRADWNEAFDITSWPVVDATRSSLFLQRLSSELDDREVEHVVVCPGPEADDPTCEIRTPPDRSRDAEDVLTELYARIAALQHQAEELADTDQRERELEVYDILIELQPDRAPVIYNRASVLYELGRLKEAIDGFLEALALGIPKQDLALRGSRTGLPHTITGSRKPSPPDYFEDVEAYLLKIESELPHYVPLLHGLATVSRIFDRGDQAIGYYGRILDIDPEDQTAKTNLHLLDEETE